MTTTKVIEAMALATEALHVERSVGAFSHAVNGVRFIVGMTLRAVGAVFGMCAVEPRVMLVWDRLQVFNGDASLVETRVVQVVTFWDRANHLLVHEAMNDADAAFPPDVSIFAMAERARPIQTARLGIVFDRGDEQSLKRDTTQIHGSHVITWFPRGVW